MSATNKTPNFDLPLFVANDVPSWLVDYNGGNTKIDTALTTIKSTADSAEQTAIGAASQVGAINDQIVELTTKVTNTQDQVTAMDGRVTTNATAITNLQGRMTSAETNITNLQSDVTGLKNVVGITQYQHTKNGTIHVLTGTAGENLNVKFYATATFNAGDTFLVNGAAKTIVTQNGEPLPDNFFVNGACVGCVINSSYIYFF